MRSLVESQPTIERICFSTGAGSAKIFKKAHKSWLAEGGFSFRDDEASRLIFGKCLGIPGPRPIQLCVSTSVDLNQTILIR